MKFKHWLVIYVVGYIITMFLYADGYIKYSKEEWPCLSVSISTTIAMSTFPAIIWPITLPMGQYIKYKAGNKYLH